MPEKLQFQPDLFPPMTYEKAVELITKFEHDIWWKDCNDLREALRMAKVALITEKLHLEPRL